MSNAILRDNPYQSPLIPTKLSLDNTLQFCCHPEISCFNECCKNIDIVLTPYDILRLKNRLGVTSSEFLANYTVPYEMDNHGMPGVKIRTVAQTTMCPFLRADGCSVYTDRPTACRYYPVGLLSMRLQDSPTDEDAYFLVKEEHCHGHQEPRTLSIRAYRHEQGVDEYDVINRDWRQIVLKKRSVGPTIGQPSVRSFQLFFLASYNLDDFRQFVQSPGFLEIYDLSAETITQLHTDEVALLKFGSRLLKQVLFGEMRIPLKADAEMKRLQRKQNIS